MQQSFGINDLRTRHSIEQTFHLVQASYTPVSATCVHVCVCVSGRLGVRALRLRHSGVLVAGSDVRAKPASSTLNPSNSQPKSLTLHKVFILANDFRPTDVCKLYFSGLAHTNPNQPKP